jgi:hypothetical protein
MNKSRPNLRDLRSSVGHISPRGWLALLLALYVGLGVTYAIPTPLFESPDESSHLSVIHYIARHRRLPPRRLPEGRITTGAAMAESLRWAEPPRYYTPPLYHVIGALLTAPFSMADLPDRLIPSPSWAAGFAPQANSDPENKNAYVHLPDETLTGSATVRAAAMLRALSLLCGAITVICAHALARTLWPNRPGLALGVAAWVALNPEFLSLSVGVTNDPLLIALFSLALGWMLRLMSRPALRARPTAWAGLGALVGVGMLTKQSALMLLPLGGLAILGQHLPGQHRSESHSDPTDYQSTEAPRPVLRQIVLEGAAFGVTALLVGGGWYLYNALRYGDPLGVAPHFLSQPPLTRFGLREIWKIFRSYWAAFGWTLILALSWVTVLIGVAVSVAIAGIARSLWPGGAFWRLERRVRLGMALLGLAFALNAASLIRWAMATGAPYGRLLFPTIAPVGVWMAWGWAQWTDLRAGRWLVGGIVGLAVLFAALSPWLLIRPAFRSPYRAQGVPSRAAVTDAAFEGGVRLAGYLAPEKEIAPGERFPFTVYWQATAPLDERLTAWVHLAPADPTARIAEETRWLGGTLYPSEHWRAGDVVAQPATLEVPAWAPAPALVWARLGLLDTNGRRVSLADGSGDEVVLGPWRVRPIDSPPAPAHAREVVFGDPALIELRGYDLDADAVDASLTVTLTWAAQAAPTQDYTVFVHLVDGEGTLLAQDDAPPNAGRYPTSWWLPGDVIRDPHTLPLPGTPSAGWKLRVGLYDPATDTRLPAFDSEGRRLSGDSAQLKIEPENGEYGSCWFLGIRVKVAPARSKPPSRGRPTRFLCLRRPRGRGL